MRRILIETSLDFKHIAVVWASSQKNNIPMKTTKELVKKYNNGLVVYKATFNRFLITVPEAHPLFGLYALYYNRNYYIEEAFPSDKMKVIKKFVRGELTDKP